MPFAQGANTEVGFGLGGGVPELVIPDTEKSAMQQACRYEPGLNRTYQELANDCGTEVLEFNLVCYFRRRVPSVSKWSPQ